VGVEPNKGESIIANANTPESFWGISQDPSPANTNAGGQGILPRYVFRNNAPFPVMTASEMHFLKAEASFAKGDKASALTSYKEGIRQNLEMLKSPSWNVNIPADKEITQGVIDNFLANTAVVPTDPNQLKLSMIMLQKYISLFVHGVLETWVDMRRYHYIDADPSGTGQVYADFVPPQGSDLFPANNGELIYRYYPRYNSEYVWNILELERIGATQTNYHANPQQKIWFAIP
jgi:Starch-binding associating with outer membrane